MKKKTMRLLKIAGNVVLYAVCLLLAISICMSLFSKITGRQLGRYGVLWVLTDSMSPTIEARSYILVEKVDPASIEVGDIITFFSQDAAIEGRLNSHRVVQILDQHSAFITKGDNNIAEDILPVPAANVVSRYVRTLPMMTSFGRLFSTTAGLIITFWLILTCCTIWLIYQYLDRAKREKESEIQKRIAEEVRKLQDNADQNH